MKIAIVGAGFSGLAAAYDLACAGAKVVLFEMLDKPGGLAGGFSRQDWSWPLDYHYHHTFENDQALKKWLGELKLNHNLHYHSTRSFSLTQQGGFAQLDSPLSLLSFPGLSLQSKLRTGAALAFLKLFPWGRVLERFSARDFIQLAMGRQSWQQLWQPLFLGKFGNQADQVNAAWFWARVHSRSKKLGYYQGGFLRMAENVVDSMQKLNVTVKLQTAVKKISLQPTGQLQLKLDNGQSVLFDKVVFTGNSRQLLALTHDQLPKSYQAQLQKLQSLTALTLVLALNKPFFHKPVYWLNVNRKDWPFLAVVEHTNLISVKHYAKQHLVYIGKYLDRDSAFLKLNQQEVLTEYHPFLDKLSPDYKKNLISAFLFRGDFAQPVVKENHSQILPQITTPLANLYFAGMEHVYPYDRGINYAVQLGRDAAQTVLQQA